VRLRERVVSGFQPTTEITEQIHRFLLGVLGDTPAK
jgi:hypothetical protein